MVKARRRSGLKTIRKTKLEREWESQGLFAGVDEVGVAAIAGPLVACAVVMPRGVRIEGVRDSKLIRTHEERVRISEAIRASAIDFSFGEVSPEEVSEIGTVAASKLAMKRAVLGLRVIPSLVVTDYHKIDLDGLPVRQVNMVKADRKIFSVACASILAKVRRDVYMRELAKKYPEYGWETSVGYRCRRHWEAIRRYGLTPHHRRKYATVWTPEQLAEYRRQKRRPR